MFDGFNPVMLLGLTALLGVMPFMIMMTTSYVKIVVVITLMRNALGVQQVPPAMAINGLAMILTFFIMGPVGMQIYDTVVAHPFSEGHTASQMIQLAKDASPPLRDFMTRNTSPAVGQALLATAKRIWPAHAQNSITKDNMLILIPSYTISEFTKAFQIGFLLYLPFIAIDLIISNILLAMGMMMVSPMTISLPFKMLLFVTLDGWLKISQGLLLSYH